MSKKKRECYARIRDLLKTHQDLSGFMTREAFDWLREITSEDVQNYDRPDWDIDIYDLED